MLDLIKSISKGKDMEGGDSELDSISDTYNIISRHKLVVTN